MPCLQNPGLVPPLPQEPSSIEKIMEIDTHMGCAMSGLTADAKMLIDHARAETQVC
jgi:20S proteasome alpha/beta subunit